MPGVDSEGSRTVGVVGTGVIGAGWAVRALARGLNVVAWDPAPGAEERMRAAVERAWPSATRLGLFPGADPVRLVWADSVEHLAGRVDWIQESAPENEDVKRPLLATLDAHAGPEASISTGPGDSASAGRPHQGPRHPCLPRAPG